MILFTLSGIAPSFLYNFHAASMKLKVGGQIPTLTGNVMELAA